MTQIQRAFFFIVLYPLALGCSNGLVGGYSPANSNAPEVIAAANYAISIESDKGTKLKLVSISKARQQVVAGMNYAFTLTVDQDGKQRSAEVVVYKDLEKNYSVTSWVWN